jgi:membrane protease YdiL (CAAX protease family)
VFNQVRHLEFAIIFFVILLGGLLAHQLGYALRLNTAWHAVLFLLLAPLLEEYVFRAMLQQWISDRFRAPRFALLASSIIFAMCHIPWIGWVAVGMLIPGLMLGLYWLRFRNLWWNVALHSAMNAVLALASAI